MAGDLPPEQSAELPAERSIEPLSERPVPSAPAQSGQGTPGTSSGCLIAIGVLALAMVIGAVIVGSAIRDAGSTVNRTVQGIQPGNVIATVMAPVTPTIIVRPPAIRQVRALADLTTLTTLMSTVVDVQQARVGTIVYEKLILIACGRVNAGVDLTKLTEQDVQPSPDGQTITVRLPKAELQDVYLIDDSTQPCTTRVYDRTNLILIPQTKELESEAREKAVQALRDMAVQSGMLSEADRNARVVIERVLLMSGYQKVVFVGDLPTIPTPIVITPTLTTP